MNFCCGFFYLNFDEIQFYEFLFAAEDDDDDAELLFSVLLTKSICAYENVGASAPVIGFGIVADIFPMFVLLATVAAVDEEHVGKSRLA